MANRSIKFGFNHMVSPSLTPEALVDAAVQAGAVAIELRNDVGANSIKDVETARRVGAKAKDRGLEVRSINALYPFNVWNDERARQTESLPSSPPPVAPSGLVMCPLNEGKLLEATPEKAAGLRAALRRPAQSLARSASRASSNRSAFRFRRCVSSARRLRRSTTSMAPTYSLWCMTPSIIVALASTRFLRRGRVLCTFRGSKIRQSASPTCWMATACSLGRRIAWAISSN